MVESQDQLLTVAIPTFNRRESLVKTLGGLLDDSPPCVRVLVVDDGSTDGTAAAVRGLDHPLVEYVRLPENQGYPAAFAAVFEHCQTPFVFLATDDDDLVGAGIRRVCQLLMQRPVDLAVTRFLRDGKHARRVTIERFRPIRPSEVTLAANHAPGIVYRRDAVSPMLKTLHDRVVARDAYALTFPQQIVVTGLLAFGSRCEWWPVTTMIERDALVSGVQDAAGRPYWDRRSMLLQSAGRMDYLLDLESSVDSEEFRASVRTMMESALRAHQFNVSKIASDSLGARITAATLLRSTLAMSKELISLWSRDQQR